MSEKSGEYKIVFLKVVCGDNSIIRTATAAIIAPDGKVYRDAAVGSGPIAATCRVINRVLGVSGALIGLSIRPINNSIDAEGEVSMTVKYNGKIYDGKGTATDIVFASALAYMNALNKIMKMRSKG